MIIERCPNKKENRYLQAENKNRCLQAGEIGTWTLSDRRGRVEILRLA